MINVPHALHVIEPLWPLELKRYTGPARPLPVDDWFAAEFAELQAQRKPWITTLGAATLTMTTNQACEGYYLLGGVGPNHRVWRTCNPPAPGNYLTCRKPDESEAPHLRFEGVLRTWNGKVWVGGYKMQNITTYWLEGSAS